MGYTYGNLNDKKRYILLHNKKVLLAGGKNGLCIIKSNQWWLILFLFEKLWCIWYKRWHRWFFAGVVVEFSAIMTLLLGVLRVEIHVKFFPISKRMKFSSTFAHFIYYMLAFLSDHLKWNQILVSKLTTQSWFFSGTTESYLKEIYSFLCNVDVPLSSSDIFKIKIFTFWAVSSLFVLNQSGDYLHWLIFVPIRNV